MRELITNLKTKIVQVLCWHKWSKYRGFYEENPAKDAVCEKCSLVYRG